MRARLPREEGFQNVPNGILKVPEVKGWKQKEEQISAHRTGKVGMKRRHIDEKERGVWTFIALNVTI